MDNNNDWPPSVTFEYQKGSIVPHTIRINAENEKDQALIQKSIFLMTKRGCLSWIKKLIGVDKSKGV